MVIPRLVKVYIFNARSANLATDKVKPTISPHLMVITCSDVFSTIITKMSIANALVSNFTTLATMAVSV